MVAVERVSFEVDAGEIVGLLGPNGAGKTTTIECVIGLREADAGSISVCGIDARRHPRQVKRRIGAALQTTALQERITPREAIALFAALHGASARPDDLLERFGLTDKADAVFDGLSAGERQRLALALAFVNAPEVVILDEPTAGLDAHARRELHAAIARGRAEGRAVLLATHDMEEAQQLCDRVAIIDRGRLVATGAPAALITQSRSAHTVEVVTAQAFPRELVACLAGIDDVTCDGSRARFRTANATETLAALTAAFRAHGIEIVELRVRKGTLEDLFVELTS